MKNKRWYHYKQDKLIGVMDWESLPDICHEWWERAQECNSAFNNIKKEDLIFVDDALKELTSFDLEYDCDCVMPYCLRHCDSRENTDLSLNYSTKKLNHYKAFRKKLGLKHDMKDATNWEELTDEQEKLYREEELPFYPESEEYLENLIKYLNKVRQSLIEHSDDTGHEEYIIYK